VDATGPAQPLVEHYFRHEYGRLVASLARVYGVHRIDAIEDAVQSALMLALTSWALRGTPSEPAAWLYRVAQRRMLDLLKSAAEMKRSDSDAAEDLAAESSPAEHYAREIDDDLLRMLFVCCDEAIPVESQLVLALKTLCGFSCAEIARALFIAEPNARKRLSRAQERLRALRPDTDTPSDALIVARRERVQAVIYLLFNEGYHSASPDRLVRRELCEEAIRLGLLLAGHALGDAPGTRALLALMYFHLARLETRVDGSGMLVLLDEQDRSRWDRGALSRACHFLHTAAEGDTFTRYHAEAGIAAEHCLAASVETTRWAEIADLYLLLDRVAPSPLNTLNRAIALAQLHEPLAGLSLLARMDPPSWLRAHHLWHAAHGELHRRAGHIALARHHLTEAIALAPIGAERKSLEKRLASCQD
jgi:RNA polymerase sigma-70 factor (ECF subfamily)